VTTDRVSFAVVVPHVIFGGAEQWTLDLIRGSCEEPGVRCVGVKVYDQSLSDDRQLDKFAELAPLSDNIAAQADVVIGWEVTPRMRAELDELGVPVINIAHRDDVMSISATMGPSDVLAAVSPTCTRSFGSRSGEVTVIPNGVMLERVRTPLSPAEARRRLGLAPDTRIVGYLGRIDDRKQCHLVADAVATLGEPWHGLLVGSPTASAGYINDYCARRAGDRVRILGATDDVALTLRAMDVFLLPSTTEAMSLSLLEAWAAGIPVLATPVGVLPELEDRFGALSVPLSTRPTGRELIEAVSASQSPLFAATRDRAKQVIEANFAQPASIRQWLSLIRRVAASK